jgi:hypothetical protein
MDGTTAVVGDDGIVASAAVEKARSRRKEWVARLENRDSNTAVTGASGRATYQSHFQQLDQTFPKAPARDRSPSRQSHYDQEMRNLESDVTVET